MFKRKKSSFAQFLVDFSEYKINQNESINLISVPVIAPYLLSAL